jgi:hypothetical protein
MPAPKEISPAALRPLFRPAVFPASHRLLFALVTVLFFLWGTSNNLTDILVQQFRKSFELSQFSGPPLSSGGERRPQQ